MSWWNPDVIISTTQLQSMSTQDIAIATYQFIVSFGLTILSFVIFFSIFRVLVWLLPKYYSKLKGFDT